MSSTGSALTSSRPPRQPFEKLAAVHERIPSAATTSGNLDAHEREIFHVQYETYTDTDTISMYFAKATPGVISHSDVLVPGILVDYTKTERVVCIDIDTYMPEMPYHLFDVPDQVDSQPPFVLRPEYDAEADKLALFFDATPAAISSEIPTEDPDIWIGVCSGSFWRAILVKHARERLLVPEMGWVDKSD